MPKGKKCKKTLEKIEELRYIRERIAFEKASIADALIQSAKGIPVLLARGTDLKWHRLTDPKRIETALNSKAEGDETVVRIYVQDPDVKAIQHALDRLCGPVTQNIELSGKDGQPLASVSVVATPALVAEAKALLEKFPHE